MFDKNPKTSKAAKQLIEKEVQTQTRLLEEAEKLESRLSEAIWSAGEAKKIRAKISDIGDELEDSRARKQALETKHEMLYLEESKAVVRKNFDSAQAGLKFIAETLERFFELSVKEVALLAYLQVKTSSACHVAYMLMKDDRDAADKRILDRCRNDWNSYTTLQEKYKGNFDAFWTDERAKESGSRVKNKRCHEYLGTWPEHYQAVGDLHSILVLPNPLNGKYSVWPLSQSGNNALNFAALDKLVEEFISSRDKEAVYETMLKEIEFHLDALSPPGNAS